MGSSRRRLLNRSTHSKVAHYTALHDCCTLPIIIYNIPSRSVVDMTPETMGELAKLDRIIGVKDATGRLERVSQQRITCGRNFVQLSGEDATALGFNAHGGVGCISVTANVAPRICAEFQEAMLRFDYHTALGFQDRLMPLHEAIFIEPGLAGAKYAMSQLKLCSDEVREAADRASGHDQGPHRRRHAPRRDPELTPPCRRNGRPRGTRGRAQRDEGCPQGAAKTGGRAGFQIWSGGGNPMAHSTQDRLRSDGFYLRSAIQTPAVALGGSHAFGPGHGGRVPHPPGPSADLSAKSL